MKKYLFILLLLFITSSVYSDTYYFRTTAFSTKVKTNMGWGSWSMWEESNMTLVIDDSDNFVIIYSPMTQIYNIYRIYDLYKDSSGNYILKFDVYDQDGDYGALRLVQRPSGDSEVYIEFADVQWAYKVIRKY